MASRTDTDSPHRAGAASRPPSSAGDRPASSLLSFLGRPAPNPRPGSPAPDPPGSGAAPPDAGAEARGSSPDAPVRYELPMPRGLFNRLTAHDGAPRCRYDTATGRAEFVAEPGPAHEWRAAEVPMLFRQVEHSLSDAGHPPAFFIAGATRLLSDDGAFEPDASLIVDPPSELDLTEFDGYLDVRKGHPVPDLVVEIDRSVASSHKLAPYFRMGVREAWTFSRRDGARIWTADLLAPSGYRSAAASGVLPGLARRELDDLLAGGSLAATSRLSRKLAERIARTILADLRGG